MENKRRKQYTQIECVQEGFANGVAQGFPLNEKEKTKMIEEATEAFGLFQEASAMVHDAAKKFAHPTALDALFEVSRMLATCHCAAEA